jgi:multiple sugar transport system ATP-binding protein
MAGVVLQNVTKVYPRQVRAAVDHIDLDISDREFMVLVGPSGCGKSTTLRLIAGLEASSEGTITIGGHVVNDVRAGKRDVAMVFQNYALYPHMSVYRNMSLGLDLRRRELGLTRQKIRERVLEAARVLHLEELLERRPRELSGGQRQRVALGRAMVRQPKVFLFDEPLSNLDAKLRVQTRAEIKKLQQRLETTTIYVTHDQEEAMTLGDRIVVMKDGVIQQVAPPLEVYDRPANRFVAGFSGTPPMNFVNGEISIDGSGKIWFVFGKERILLPAFTNPMVRSWGGRELVLGVRPEGLSPSGEGKFAAAHNTFNAKVNMIEPLGDRVDLALSTESNEQFVCRADSHEFGKLAVGGIISVHVDLRKVHLFEPGDNGVNITLTRESSHAAA